MLGMDFYDTDHFILHQILSGYDQCTMINVAMKINGTKNIQARG